MTTSHHFNEQNDQLLREVVLPVQDFISSDPDFKTAFSILLRHLIWHSGMLDEVLVGRICFRMALDCLENELEHVRPGESSLHAWDLFLNEYVTYGIYEARRSFSVSMTVLDRAVDAWRSQH